MAERPSADPAGAPSRHPLLELPDGAFLTAWRSVTEEEKTLIPAADRMACVERYRKLSPTGQTRRAAKEARPGADGLIRGESGAIKPCEHNAIVLLRAAPEFEALSFDNFRYRMRIDGRDWTDADDVQALVWLQRTHRVAGFRLNQARAACMAIAHERQRDALREFIEALPAWDGTPRIELAFSDAWGARDDELTRAASRNLFIALIARALNPGSQVDTLWCLEGPQGNHKSKSLRALGGVFHAEISAAIGTNDYLRELRGLWIAELSELDSLRGREASTIKRLLSAPRDRFVEKFQIHAISYPRRAVSVATTNEAEYWQDSTGARRLVPVRVGEIRLDIINENRRQWFAEARALYEGGASWWEFPAAIAGEQDERQAVDPWEDMLRAQLPAESLSAGVWISSAAIMADVLKLQAHQIGQASGVRLGRVMRRLGFMPERRGKARERGWVKADTREPE